jgi:hypothetical protein
VQSTTVLVAAVLALAGCAGSPADAPAAVPDLQASSPSELPDRAVDPAITYVVTGPTVFGDHEEFEHRIIVRKSCSPEHCFDSAQLDWIIYTEYAPSSPVVRSVEITELRDALAVVSEVPTIVSEPNDRVTITLLLTATYTSEQGVLCVWPDRSRYRAEIRPISTSGLTRRCS